MKIWKWGHGGGQGIHYSTQPTGSELKELVAQWAKLLFMRWPWKARELSLHSQLAALVRKGFVYLNKEKASISLFLPSNPITTSSSLLTSMFRVASAFFIPFLCATIRSPFKPSSGLLVIISHRADSTSHLMKGEYTSAVRSLLLYVIWLLTTDAFCLPSKIHHFTCWGLGIEIPDLFHKYKEDMRVIAVRLKVLVLVRDTDLELNCLCLLIRRIYRKLTKFKFIPGMHNFLPNPGMGSSNFVHIVYIYSIHSFWKEAPNISA